MVRMMTRKIRWARYLKMLRRSASRNLDFGSWTRNGDHLENTATKDGKSWKLRIHVTTGAMEETVVSARR